MDLIDACVFKPENREYSNHVILMSDDVLSNFSNLTIYCTSKPVIESLANTNRIPLVKKLAIMWWSTNATNRNEAFRMKTFLRLIAMLLAGFLFLSCVPAHAITSAEKENNYNAAVLELETYLESYGNDSAALLGISATFNDLHGYAKSTCFVNYISVLMKIAGEEYDSDMDFLLFMLEVNEGFKKYLEDMRNDSSIGTINELEAYARAREYEHNGNMEAAMENYRQCLDFFDSQHRLTTLYNAANETAYAKALEMLQSKDYAGAYYAFSEISRYGDSAERMRAIVNQLGYTPADASDNLMPVTGLKASRTTLDQITLSWQKSSHAQQYEVYDKESNKTEWKHAADTAETTMTVTGLKQETSYDFKVVAAIGRLKADETVLTNQKTASVTPTPKPTPTPTPTPTPRPAPTPTPTLSAADLGFEYTKVSANEIAIKKYTGKKAELVIPAQLDGFKVVAINDSAFQDCLDLTSVVIPNSVTSIGKYCFSKCSNLIDVSISSSVTSIGEWAFTYCYGLSGVTIPNSVTSIGECAFYRCTNLKSVTIPSSVINFGNHAFSYCKNLENVIISYGVTSIGKYAFENCSSLKNVTIPNTVTSIGDSAFLKCSSLTSVTIPDSVTSIGESAFRMCYNLTYVSIPSSVVIIGDYAFSMRIGYDYRHSNLTIYDPSNSAAEVYAKKNGIPFVNNN